MRTTAMPAHDGGWGPKAVRGTFSAGVTIIAIFCLMSVGCQNGGGDAGGSGQASDAGTVTISVAASTQDAIEEIAKMFEDETGVKVAVNAASSSSLAQQILSGAPVDLYLSASKRWADAVEKEKPVTARRVLLHNQLVLIVPKGNPANVSTPEDLTSERVERVALAGEEVPAGRYARQSLESLGLKKAIEDAGKIAAGDNVRVTLSHVALGEAGAGVVYATDAAAADVETVMVFPADSHDPIIYPLLQLSSGDDNPAASQFYDYLASPDATAVFEKHGFAVPSEGDQP